MKLRQTIIFAKNMDRMTAFYRDALGLRPLPDASATWAQLDAGGTTLALHAIPSEIAARIDISTPPRAREETPIKLAFETPDIEATRAHLVAHGAVMFEVRSGGACDGLDPEGNVFQIVKP